MSRVLVKNDNRYVLEEKFRDQNIVIQPGKAIEMDREDAIAFKSAFHPPKIDYNGQIDPKSFKKISIHPIGAQAEEVKEPKFINHATGDEYDSEEQYLAALKADEELLARNKAANELDVKNVRGKGKHNA